MTKEEFKKQRAALVAKLAWLAIEINEQGKYYVDCDIAGYVNYIRIRVYLPKDLETGQSQLYKFLHPYSNMDRDMDYAHSEKQYELIIADLQNSYNKMLEFLEV